MPKLEKYDVVMNGVETTLLLDADDAASRGLGYDDLSSTRQAAADAAAEKAEAAATRAKAAKAAKAEAEARARAEADAAAAANGQKS